MNEQQKATAALNLITRATIQVGEIDAAREVIAWLQDMVVKAMPAPAEASEQAA